MKKQLNKVISNLEQIRDDMHPNQDELRNRLNTEIDILADIWHDAK